MYHLNIYSLIIHKKHNLINYNNIAYGLVTYKKL